MSFIRVSLVAVAGSGYAPPSPSLAALDGPQELLFVGAWLVCVPQPVRKLGCGVPLVDLPDMLRQPARGGELFAESFAVAVRAAQRLQVPFPVRARGWRLVAWRVMH